MSDPTAELVTERHGAVLLVRLNRPQARNALTGAVIRGIGAAVRTAEQDPDVRVVVLTGTGDRAFCAGMDLRAFADGGDFSGNGDPDSVAAVDAYERLSRGKTDVPVIGAANGSAVGGGLELLLGCDIIIAAATASFGLPEVKRGLFPGGSGTALGSRIPLGVALEMTLTGEAIDADRAYRLGLANSVVPQEEVLTTALALAERIAANAPLGLAACKELVRLGVTDAASATERLSHWQAIVFSSEDAKEGASAFMQKRAPVWQGK
ncbi:enoyl-CoA hydratase/isomerase family protein [Nocardia callitridis]|uniref:Crotonase/enoyl-CoA hydratase family protein n=1 Tax=Nocardia callitridis TaxID=648753 RepID=A0ABP9K8Y7_9NOCA